MKKKLGCHAHRLRIISEQRNCFPSRLSFKWYCFQDQRTAACAHATSARCALVEVMREKNIDVSRNKPKLVNDEMVRKADVIVVMGCSAEGFCPANLLNKVRDWILDDQKGTPIEKVREIRDKIEGLVLNLIQEIQ